MNILIIKLSSLGDVLHNLPIVWDIRAQYPDAHIDWLVEENYVNLLTPLLSNTEFKGIDGIIPIALRRWKKSLLSGATYQELKALRQQLKQREYDLVIETQGLIKAAIFTRLAKRKSNAVIAGLANATQDSGYEPLSRMFYTQSVTVPLLCHAVERSRLVAAAAMQMPRNHILPAPRFYPENFLGDAESMRLLSQPYVLLFHATARAAKQWSEAAWVAIGNALAQQGLTVVLPWGSHSELQTSKRLSDQILHAQVPVAMSVQAWFSAIKHAELVIGVDTGLTHMAAILNHPTIEIYCDSPRWKTQGYWSTNIINLGDTGTPPSVEEVKNAIAQLRQ